MNQSLRKEFNTEYCECCGKPAETEALHLHHVKHRASGGQDTKENLILLCATCHTKVHAGNISAWQLILIISEREGKTPDEICEAIGLLVNKLKPSEFVLNIAESPYNGRTLEEILQLYVSCVEVTENMTWTRAELMTVMMDSGIKQNTISSLVGCSPATVREYIRTYRAFPREEMRAQDFSFTHHIYAAKTKEPEKWIDLCCIEGLSTRQLKEKIIEKEGGHEITRDKIQEKAERILRMIKEIFNSDNHEIKEWLVCQLDSCIPALGKQPS